MQGLTKRQEEILSFIKNFIDDKRYSPSLREIQSHFEFSSLGSVQNHIRILKRKGHLLSDKQTRRSLAVTTPEQTSGSTDTRLPFIGSLTSENTIETFEQIRTLSVPSNMVANPDETYLLRIRGDKLESEMIADGDLLIVEARNQAETGELVLALIENFIYLKRYYPEGNYIRFGKNDPFRIRSEQFQLQGVVMGLLRTYR